MQGLDPSHVVMYPKNELHHSESSGSTSLRALESRGIEELKLLARPRSVEGDKGFPKRGSHWTSGENGENPPQMGNGGGGWI